MAGNIGRAHSMETSLPYILFLFFRNDPSTHCTHITDVLYLHVLLLYWEGRACYNTAAACCSYSERELRRTEDCIVPLEILFS